MFRKKKKQDEYKPLKHITVYFPVAKSITYNNPSNCTINENSGMLNIQVKNQSIFYNIQQLLAYEFEEEES